MALKHYGTPAEALNYLLFVLGHVRSYAFYITRKTDGYGQFFVFTVDHTDTGLGTLYLVDMAERFVERRRLFDGIAYEQERDEEVEEDVNDICHFPLTMNERAYKSWLKSVGKETHPGTDEDIRMGRTVSWKNGLMSAVHHRFRLIPSPYEKEMFSLPPQSKFVSGNERREWYFYWDELKLYADGVYAVEGFSARYFEVMEIAARNFG